MGDSAAVIRGNFILKNDQDRITIQGAFCPAIEDKRVTHNGGSGILVSVVRGCQVQDNTVNANAVTESASTPAASRGPGIASCTRARTCSGTVLVQSCRSQNVFKTSQPAVLPVCP